MKNNISDMVKKVKELQDAFNGASSALGQVDMISDSYADLLGLIASALENQQHQEKEIKKLKDSLARHVRN